MAQSSFLKKFTLGVILAVGLLLSGNAVRADMIVPATPYQDWHDSGVGQRTQQEKLPDVVIGGVAVLVVMISSFITLSKIRNKNVS